MVTATEAMHPLEWITAGPLALGLSWEEGLLAELDLGWAAEVTGAAEPSPTARALAGCLASYLAGEAPVWPDLPFAWQRLTPFSRQVLQTLFREVPFGHTVTYGRLAAMAGRPNAARAVGRAMALNPWPLVVPCHRVLGSGGKLHGFSGCGLSMKRFLLGKEGHSRPGWETEKNAATRVR